MTIMCSQCGKQAPDRSQFCGACGADLAATSVGGRTVVSRAVVPGVAAPLSSAEHRTIVDRLQRRVGGTIAMSVPGMGGDESQHEMVFFINDISGSMAAEYDRSLTKLQAASQAAQTLLLHKDPSDELGLISFNDTAQLLMPLRPICECKDQALTTLQRLSICGGTDLETGLDLAEQHFDWHQGSVVRRVILLTDGQGGDPRAIASSLKSRGVVIDAIGIGRRARRRDVNEPLLREVASMVDGRTRYRFLSSLEELVGHYTILAGKTAVR